MILKKLKDITYILFLLPLFFITEKVTAQCDVFIEPGSVQVMETSDAVMFTFNVVNNSTSEWEGDDVLMYWTLNSGVNIMSINYGDGSDPGHPPPLQPGETATFYTPFMAMPNLPEWFPEEPGPGGDLDDNWVDALDWPFWSANPNGFDGTWSQINLRLGSCGLGDGAWVYDSEGEPYFGPSNESVCQDNNDDAFCDCDITVTGYDQDNYTVSIEVNSSYNCGCNPHTDDNFMDCYDSATASAEENMYIDHLVFGLNVQTLDEDWLGCLDNDYHEGWTFGILSFPFNPLESGDMVSEQIQIFNDCWTTMQDLAPNSLCLQMVVWQINFSATAYSYLEYDDTSGWAATCGICNFDTQAYPDIDISDNLVVWCFDEDPPTPDIPGCTDPEANNYNPEANIDDETCTYDILGCMNPVACNYNDEATINDGSCITCDTPYEEGLEGCSSWEWYIGIFNCYGCTDPSAINYDPSAQNDDGSCEYLTSPDAVPDLDFIGYECIDGVPYNLAKVTVKNSYFQGNTANDTLFVYCVEVPELGLDSCLNGYESAGSFIEPGGGQLIWNNILIPNDVIQLTVNVYNTEGETDQELLNNTITVLNIIQNSEVCDILGCTDSTAINYNPDATDDDGSCEYPIITDLSFDTLLYVTGCDEFGPYWSAQFQLTNLGNTPITEWCINADILSTPENDTICFDFTTIMPGETYIQQWPNVYDWGVLSLHVLHVNGNSGVSFNQFGDDSSVSNNMYVQIISDEPNCTTGCTDSDALNYNPDAVIDDGSCQYSITELTYIDAECFVDCNVDGPFYYVNTTWTNTGNVEITDFCAEWDVTGGEESTECFSGNLLPGDTIEMLFGPFTTDQGLLAWAYLESLNGVTFDPPIENYETLYCWGEAVSSCIYGCIDNEANNYNPDADLDDGSCEYDIFGCTDPEANNYNSSANVDDGSCTYDVFGCTDSTANNYNPLATVDDGSCTYDVYGCTDESANNYNPNANTDDGSCEYDVFGCTDEVAVNYNPFANIDDGSCEYEVFGCTDPEALNYNSLATSDDGTCIYPQPCESFDGSVYISNSFTPDNDGINDIWKAFTVNECWQRWELTVLNRWGNIIWKSDNPSDIWDGSFQGGDYYVQNGMYVYKLIGVTKNLNYVDKNGYVMVVR